MQPVPRGTVGGTRPHARLSARLLVALAARVAPPCEAFGPDLKVIARGRVRFRTATGGDLPRAAAGGARSCVTRARRAPPLPYRYQSVGSQSTICGQ